MKEKIKLITEKLMIFVLVFSVFITFSFTSKKNEVHAFADPLTTSAVTAVMIAMTMGLGVQILIDSGAVDNAADALGSFATTAYSGALDLVEKSKSGFKSAFQSAVAAGSVGVDMMKDFTKGLVDYFESNRIIFKNGTRINLTNLNQFNVATDVLMNHYITNLDIEYLPGVPYYESHIFRLDKSYSVNYITDSDKNLATISFLTTDGLNKLLFPELKKASSLYSRNLIPIPISITVEPVIQSFKASDLGLVNKPVLAPGQPFKNVSRKEYPEYYYSTSNTNILSVVYNDFPTDLLGYESYDNHYLADGSELPYFVSGNSLIVPIITDVYSEGRIPSTKQVDGFALVDSDGFRASESDWGVIADVVAAPADFASVPNNFNDILIGQTGAIAIPQNPTFPGINEGILSGPLDLADTEEWEKSGVVILDNIGGFPSFPELDWSPPSVGDLVTGGIIGGLLGWLGSLLSGILNWLGQVIIYGFNKVIDFIKSIPQILRDILSAILDLSSIIYNAIVSALEWLFVVDFEKVKLAWKNLLDSIELKIPLFFDIISLLTLLMVNPGTNPPKFTVTFPNSWGGGTYSIFDITLIDNHISKIRLIISAFIWLMWSWKFMKKLANFFNK